MTVLQPLTFPCKIKSEGVPEYARLKILHLHVFIITKLYSSMYMQTLIFTLVTTPFLGFETMMKPH